MLCSLRSARRQPEQTAESILGAFAASVWTSCVVQSSVALIQVLQPQIFKLVAKFDKTVEVDCNHAHVQLRHVECASKGNSGPMTDSSDDE